MNDKEKFEAAKEILVNALCAFGAEGSHTSGCEAARFARANRCLPANHPAWKSAPACSCVIGQIAAFLENN